MSQYTESNPLLTIKDTNKEDITYKMITEVIENPDKRDTLENKLN